MLNYKMWRIIWTVCMYLMWFGLFLSVFVDGQVFLKLGIVMASIVAPTVVKTLKELESGNVEKK